MTRLSIRGDYTSDWASVSRAVRDAAGWRCVRCKHPFDPETGRPLPCDARCDVMRGRKICLDLGGHPSLTPRHGHEISGLNFGVHHLDGDKSNNAWWNNLALCNSCHLSIQATVIPERPFMLRHSEWFIPYVCGFFASQVGLEITREQALANPDEYLRIGQPWLYADADATGTP